ncbi:MAG: RagB/SusD family nutrient uptake outer membrane protein [Dysgonamonadaceae bacterium]|nr:RagB/SusD family nutrient uptake outer membrane protein [Dysgonamonadaceae bacterium]
MKNRINIAIFVSCLILLAGTSSCEDIMGDFLEKEPSSDITIDTIFSSARNTEALLASIYQFGIHANLGYGSAEVNGYKDAFADPSPNLFSGATDESEVCAAWYETNWWNAGDIYAERGGNVTEMDGRFEYRFKAIRLINILLNNIDRLPDTEMDNATKNMLKAESKTIRALNYLEMLKRYGGMPIVETQLTPDGNLKIPRSTLEETVDFIVKDCDEAIKDLPVHQLGTNRGRVHEGVARAVKAKTLLYAASPLFNTDKPYMSFPNPEDNRLICYGNEDKARWQKAAIAAKEVLAWAVRSNYCKLITDKGNERNYAETWDVYDNPEIILAQKQAEGGTWVWPWGNFSKYTPPNKGEAGVTPLMNFIKKYEKQNGTKQTWANIGVGDPLIQEKMLELDLRFRQTVQYNMSYWDANWPVCPLYLEAARDVEETGPKLRGAISECYGGFWLHKGRPYIVGGDDHWWYSPNSTLFQLNEFYISYAEAAYEYAGNADVSVAIPVGDFSLTAREAVNTIRARVGQPPINEAIYKKTGDTDNGFRNAVRNERDIELAFDNHRFWDIRRWLQAEEEGVMKGDMIGLKINITTPVEDYTKAPIDHGYTGKLYKYETRTFLKRMYLHPFHINEVHKGYLKQNPGY